MKNKKITIILSIVIVSIASGIYAMKYTTAANKKTEPSNTSKKKGIQPFSVKLPDGLYLYQPFIYELFPSPANDKILRPLFIAENGKLVDPFERAVQIGREVFNNRYLKGKKYNAYIENSHIGMVSNIQLNACKLKRQLENDSLPDLRGYGKYKGSLWHSNVKKYFDVRTKAVLTPKKYINSGKMSKYKFSRVTYEYAMQLIEKKLFPKLLEKGVITKRHIISLSTRQDTIPSILVQIDFDKNGIKDYIGTFHFTHPIDYKHQNKTRGIFFLVRNNMDIELIDYFDELTPGVRLIGGIDINNDGYKEIIVNNLIAGIEPQSRMGMKTKIYYKDVSKWRVVFITRNAVCN